MPASLFLRPYEEGDVTAFTQLINNPAVYRFLSTRLPIPYTVDLAHEFIALCRRGERIERAIIVDGELAGGIGCALPEPGSNIYSMGYWLGQHVWGRGIMTRTVQLLLEELRAGLVPSGSIVEAKVFAVNIASQRVLLHAGFRQLPGFVLIPMRDSLQHITYSFRLVL